MCGGAQGATRGGFIPYIRSNTSGRGPDNSIRGESDSGRRTERRGRYFHRRDPVTYTLSRCHISLWVMDGRRPNRSMNATSPSRDPTMVGQTCVYGAISIIRSRLYPFRLLYFTLLLLLSSVALWPSATITASPLSSPLTCTGADPPPPPISSRILCPLSAMLLIFPGRPPYPLQGDRTIYNWYIIGGP